jgi:hypothetical protein
MTPGDAALRHDLQVLSDAGALSGPSMSWPIAWSLIDKELDSIDADALPAFALSSLQRLRLRGEAEQSVGRGARIAAGASAGTDPMVIRTFDDQPRGEAGVSLAADGATERLAWKVSVSLVEADPLDDQTVRLDGSYLALGIGNWSLSAGLVDRWWGPGWQGSLILSTNARPIPAIALDRIEPRAFDVPVLRWLGPWRFSTFMGMLEEDRDYPNALLFGMRAEIRPIPSLQIAASRTAQWCGEGRPCGLGTFWDLLTGNDNDQSLDEQPGNQLAGFDVRWSWPGSRVPVALYAQGIGEDEAGFLPSKYLGLFGLEIWGAVAGGGWRAHLEYADTSCDFLSSAPEYGCAYTNAIYRSGYRYRHRAIGHAIDADGQSIGGGLLFLDSAGHRWELIGRRIDLNRAGEAPGHSLADGPAELLDVALTHEQAFGWGNITVSVGYADVDSRAHVGIEEGIRGFVTWRYDWF